MLRNHRIDVVIDRPRLSARVLPNWLSWEPATSSLSEYPAFAPARRYVVASLGQLGRIAEAEAELQQFMAIAPKVFSAVAYNRPSFLQRTQQEDLLEGFRKAGWQY